MKKIILFVPFILMFICCNDDTNDIIQQYQTKRKSQELVGFWKLKGIYPPNLEHQNTTIEISFNNEIGIVENEILFLDIQYLRFLNKSRNVNDSVYILNSKNKYLWYNEAGFIKSLFQAQQADKLITIKEYQFPYKFGQTKDSLIVENNGKVYYLLKQISVDYKEYD